MGEQGAGQRETRTSAEDSSLGLTEGVRTMVPLALLCEANLSEKRQRDEIPASDGFAISKGNHAETRAE